MKTFCFTVDDNIRFLKEITQSMPGSLFENPYLAMFKRLHEAYGVKVQLNLFYRTEGFDLSEMMDRYRREWAENAHWLKLSFHSDHEKEKPYEFSGYDEVHGDCRRVHEQIRRFAGEAALAKTTTVHYCLATKDGLRALFHNGVRGLLGLFGNPQRPATSYGLDEETARRIRTGDTVKKEGIAYASIDMILNGRRKEEIPAGLEALKGRACIRVMIHEQYFYPDYKAYQPDFEEKLELTFSYLCNNGFHSVFFEENFD